MSLKKSAPVLGLSREQAAARAQVSIRTLDRLIQTKKIPVIKVGMYTRIEEQALQAYQNSL